MPAKRRVGKMRALAITPEAVEAFRAGNWIALHRALGLKPWEASPLHAERHAERPSSSVYAESLPQALELKAQLEKTPR